MLDLRKLIDFLPYYYKQNDTYKVDGKGILERYLDIFGNYFQDNIIGDIDNILDIIDINTCNPIYLNYLWEFLGEMPFAYGINIDKDKWKDYFNGFKSDEEIQELANLWIIPKADGPFKLDLNQVRNLLKYSVALFKIRGTEMFFEILFRLYGLTCTIHNYDAFTEDIDYYGSDQDYAGSESVADNDAGDYAGKSLYTKFYKDSKMDIWDSFLDKQNLDRVNNYEDSVTIPVLITGHPYTDYNDINFIKFQGICESIFDRFLPINVNAKITYGIDIPQTYHVELKILDPKTNEWLYLKSDTDIKGNANNLSRVFLQDNLMKEIYIKAIVTRSYRNISNLTFRINDGEQEHLSDSYIFTINKHGTYTFKSSIPNSDGNYTSLSLEVNRKKYLRYYNIGYDSSVTLNITNANPVLTIPITASINIYNGDNVVNYGTNLILENTGKIYTPTLINGIYTYNWEVSKPGIYTFSLVDFPIKKIILNITRDPEIFTVHCNPVSGMITKDISTISTILNITRSYEDTDPNIKLLALYDSNKNLIKSYDSRDYKNGIESLVYTEGTIPKYLRFSCISNPQRSSSQYLKINKQGQYYNIIDLYWDNIYKGGYINSDGEVVNASNWEYSDYLDISEYISSDQNIKSQIEYNLICSHLTCYELNNRDTLYNCGESFITKFAGTYIFKSSNNAKTDINGVLNIDSSLEKDVVYDIYISPRTVYYPNVSTNPVTVNALITVSTNLPYQEGLSRDTDGMPLSGFSIRIFEASDWFLHGSNGTVLASITPEDSGWVPDNNNSLYQKRLSYKFTKSSDNPEDTIFPPGRYLFVLSDDTYYSVNVANYIDTTTVKPYIEPYDPTDTGWLSPDWSDANSDKSIAVWNLLKGTPLFRILLNNDSNTDSNSVIRLYKVTLDKNGNEIETYMDVNYGIGDTIDDLNGEGIFRFKLDDNDDNYAQITIHKSLIFGIICSPTISTLNEYGYAITNVIGSANADTDISNLQVKQVTEKVWHNSPYSFTAQAVGDYNFIIRGDQTKIITFRVIPKNDNGIAPTSLSFDSGATTPKSIDIASNSNWSVEIVDD